MLVQDSDNLNQFQQTDLDPMTNGNWRFERQTPDNSNKKVGNGMAKTDQCDGNRKLGNSDQNQLKKYNLRSRNANDISLIVNQLMLILNVLR